VTETVPYSDGDGLVTHTPYCLVAATAVVADEDILPSRAHVDDDDDDDDADADADDDDDADELSFWMGGVGVGVGVGVGGGGGGGFFI
jgi:hypothetical protein